MNKKGSLFHISKRDALPLPKALLIRGGILLLALRTDHHPADRSGSHRRLRHDPQGCLRHLP